MTVAVAQSKQTSVAVATTSIPLAFTTSVGAGSTLHTACFYDPTIGTPVVSVSDSVNGSHTLIDTVVDTPNTSAMQHFRLVNSGSGTITVTASFGSACGYALWIKEISGAVTSGAPNAFAQTNQTVSSGDIIFNVSPTAQPGLISAFCANDTNTVAPTAGGTYTDEGQGWNFAGANNSADAANLRVTATGSTQVIFSPAGGGGTYNYLGVAAVFLESGSGPPVVPPSQFFMGVEIPLVPLSWIIRRRQKLLGRK